MRFTLNQVNMICKAEFNCVVNLKINA